jgi:methyl-accepting chemotaxis protein
MKKNDLYIISFLVIILILWIILTNISSYNYNKDSSILFNNYNKLEKLYIRKIIFLKLKNSVDNKEGEKAYNNFFIKLEKTKLPDIILYEKIKDRIKNNKNPIIEFKQYLSLYDKKIRIIKDKISLFEKKQKADRKIYNFYRESFLFILLLFFLYIFYFIKYKLLKDVKNVNKIISKLAYRELDMDEQFFHSNNNSHFVLGKIFNKLKAIIDSFKNFITPLTIAGSSLSNIFINIQESTKYQSSIINEEAASLNQVASSTEELSITAKEIADVAKDIEKNSHEGKEMAQQGEEIIGKVVESVLNVKEEILKTAKQNIETVEKSKNIDKILEVMEDITSEIHLLALNASIESAGAGAYGERFAVIAQEIRELADNSKDIIEKIKENIESFHNSLNSAVLSIDYNAKQVEKTTEIVKESGKYFKKLFKIIDESVNYSKHIANATLQQQVASEQIVEVMREVTDVINSSANEITKINNNMDKIMEVAVSINSLIQTFKTDNKNNFRKIIEEVVNNSFVKNMDMEKMEEIFRETYEKNAFFEAIYFADKEGMFKVFVCDEQYKEKREKVLKVSMFEREWFKKALEGEKFVFTKPYISLFSGKLHFTFSAPVIKNGEFVGAVGIDVNYKEWIEANPNEF